MPKYFPVEGETTGLLAPDSGGLIEDVSLSNTSINNCHIPAPSRPARRTVVRRVKLYRIQHYSCYAHGALFEDVIVTDLRGGRRAPSFFFGCAFKNVVLRGWIGGFMVRSEVGVFHPPRIIRRYRKANLALYRSMDWALDITEAQFSSLDSFESVPAHLVRRNPDMHFVITRSSADAILATNNTSIWSIVAKQLIRTGMPDMVVVAGGTGGKLRAYLDEAKALRDKRLLL